MNSYLKYKLCHYRHQHKWGAQTHTFMLRDYNIEYCATVNDQYAPD